MAAGSRARRRGRGARLPHTLSPSPTHTGVPRRRKTSVFGRRVGARAGARVAADVPAHSPSPQVFFSSSTMKDIIAPAAAQAAQIKGKVSGAGPAGTAAALPLPRWPAPAAGQ